jgi:TfoX/Sxy family transcriptional regulator of competence genes
VISNKLNTTITHPAVTNYWTPFTDNDDDEPTTEEESINTIKSTKQKHQPKSNKWKRRSARRHEMRQQRNEESIIIDSGATSHFVTEGLNLPATGPSDLTVYLPDDSTLRATSATQLPFEQLSDEARRANILPGLTKSLISVNKLAENGYTTIFRPGNEGVTFHKKGTLTITTSEPPVLQGHKRRGENLWTVSVPKTKSKREEAANVYNLPSIAQTIKYLHAAAGYPTEDTWIKAIKAGNYISWPGLTATAARKHFPESDETHKGHMKRQRQGVRSTKTLQTINEDEENATEEHDSPVTPKPKKMKDLYVKVHSASDTMYTDQPGRFPATSSSGNQYIMVLVEVDGNYIDAEPMKNRSAGSMIKAYLALWARITATGTIRPTTHLMDNEASAELKAEIKKNCSIQLVPPDNHRRNLAERAIQTFKSHFKSVLAGVDDSFPMRLWDKLLPQTILTLNLLRQSNVAPTVSAYQYVHGTFDYNKMPLAPLGCAVQLYESNARRGTWAEHSTDGWYIGTSTEHYRCHRIYVKQTRSERISDTVFFKHKYITQPTVTPADTIVKALDDLTHALKGRRNVSGAAEIEALEKIDEILNNIPKQLAPAERQERRTQVTFDATTAPPKESVTPTARRMATPRPNPRPSLTTATIDKPIPTNAPIPRVRNDNGDNNTPTPRVRNKVTKRPPTIAQQKLKSTMRDKANSRARIPHRTHMQLRQQEQRELVQLIRDDDTGEYLNYRQLMRSPKHRRIWNISSANEFGRLAQGLKDGRVTGTNTIFFIPKELVPKDRLKDVTYGSFSCDMKPNKKESHRTRLTAGGDRINYPEDVGTPTADMTLVKTFFNSVISTKNAKCVMADIKDFYLNTPMKRYEYMRLKITDIPEEVIEYYNLRSIVTEDGYVYCEIRKGMYGLPQAGIIAQLLLQERLAKVGYHQSKIIPGLWTHETRNICFTLVVDDFAIKYVKKEDADHLLNALQKDYTVSTDWEATKYIGLTIEWDYQNRKVHIHMPGYLAKALQRFKHPTPTKQQNSPHPHIAPQYGAKVQYTPDDDESPPLDKEDTKYIQAVAGTLLYYGRAVDNTILTSLSAIATEQAKPTQKTMEVIKQLLDYCATQEDAIITYRESKMILQVHSDAGYCNEKKSRSRAGGHFFLSNGDDNSPNNGAILTIATIIKAVMSSAAEAELGALYLNAREAIYLRQILTEMGHPQPRTPIQTDNSTAEGVVNSTIQPKRTKAMDMRFHWLRDREAQGQLRIYWRPGKTNLADYFTKHHPPAHHVNVRSEFLTRVKDLAEARRQRQEQSQTKPAKS